MEPVFENLMRLIENHPRYGPAMLRGAALAEHEPLVLNYHKHQDAATWCVSICSRTPSPLDIFGKPELKELVHIRDFGRSEEQCGPLSRRLAATLQEHYLLERRPELFKNGTPFEGFGTGAEEPPGGAPPVP